jgi:hypothetical protein
VIKKQIENLIEVLKQEKNAERQIEYVLGMVDAAVNYARSIVIMETRMKSLKFRLEPAEYQVEVEAMDKKRRLTHNAFISKLDIVNRICTNHNLPVIYTGENNRAEKGEFAFDIVESYKVNVRG